MHALSIPTWMIHISSVIEWIAAIWLIWIYSEVSQNPTWRALSIAMLPLLISAMCACTWHFFDNTASLEWLVTLQAATTLLGNCTLCIAGWWIWRSRKDFDLSFRPEFKPQGSAEDSAAILAREPFDSAGAKPCAQTQSEASQSETPPPASNL